jgi:hypothetical protein
MTALGSLAQERWISLGPHSLYHGDCLEMLASLGDDSVDACVTDPPYGLSAPPDIAEVLRHWLADDTYKHSGRGFMGRNWDSFVPGPNVWRELFRVLKPGAHAVVFAGQRTVDLMTIALRIAGFEVRELFGWLQWQGFPKSLDLSKEMDRIHGAEREVVGTNPHARPIDRRGGGGGYGGPTTHDPHITAPASADAETWNGWGTALKPCIEPAVRVQKPFSAVPYRDTMAAIESIVEVLLWQMSPAKFAELVFESSRADSVDPPSGSARWLAAAWTTLESLGLSGLMAMFKSPAEAGTFWSIAQSWKSISVASWTEASTSTTSTATEVTTAWRTLRSLALQITQGATTKAVNEGLGLWLDVTTADVRLSGSNASSESIPRPSAIEPATWSIGAAVVGVFASIAESGLWPHLQVVREGSAVWVATTLRENELDECIEPAVIVRKPISESSIARNVLRWGTGALNIDACRYAYGDDAWPGPQDGGCWGGVQRSGPGSEEKTMRAGWTPGYATEENPLGRFPANVFACPKASTSERELGCEGLAKRQRDETRRAGDPGGENPRNRGAQERGNCHPTVKPARLIRWLLRLVTPPGGVVVDPFVGSGTVYVAAGQANEHHGLDCTVIGSELGEEPGYIDIPPARFEGWRRHGFPLDPPKGPAEQRTIWDV